MKRLLTAVLCLLIIGVFSFAFAGSTADKAQKNQAEEVQQNDSDQMTQEAKQLPSTLMTGEEQTDLSALEEESNVNPWQARYEDIPTNTE